MGIADNMWALGIKLKNTRTIRGYTLAEVAEAVGFSPQFLSMVEKGKSGISVSKLEALLSFYKLTFADLVETKSQNKAVVHVDQLPNMGEYFGGIESYLIFDKPVDAQKRTNVTLFRLQPGMETEKWQHEGWEFIFVLDGTLEVNLTDPETGESKRHLLAQWDSIQHSSTMGHYCANRTTKEVSFIVGCVE